MRSGTLAKTKLAIFGEYSLVGRAGSFRRTAEVSATVRGGLAGETRRTRRAAPDLRQHRRTRPQERLLVEHRAVRAGSASFATRLDAGGETLGGSRTVLVFLPDATFARARAKPRQFQAEFVE